ncbi:hypothetical protein EU538_12150 [Candidatus Thorarchaeota archaeon]|nr:MAG: hypothetical protein EU538_12150 [Candidatus Thorarchaeota archaeon]
MWGGREYLVFCAICGLLTVGFAAVPSAAANEPLAAGPFVDKILYSVIEGDDQQVLALQNNEIDLIGDMIDPGHLPTLSAAEDIAVASLLRNGYGYITIKCDKYPFNITAFRRAVAFATDKQAISADVWDGLSEPLDSCVPKVNPYSTEGLLGYTYYEADVEVGNQLLDAAGFADHDEDGFREAPDGSDFDVVIKVAQSSNVAIEVGAMVAQALQNLHIDAVSQPTDFYEYLTQLYFHGDYDMVFLGASFTDFDVDWLAYDYWSEYADVDYWNFPCWANATYDSYRDQLLHSVDYQEVYEAAFAMQEIWVHSSPVIVCYENMEFSAYRTDRFEGFVDDVRQGVPGWWTNYKVHLKQSEGGPFGGTFRRSNPLDVDTFNFMASSSVYTKNVVDELYDSLLRQGMEGEDMLWLAESYTAETHEDNPAVPVGHNRFVFDMVQNATWTDGTLLTAYDAAFTLNYYLDAPGNPYGTDLTEMIVAYASANYTLVIEFSTVSYWHLHTVGYKPVLPKHVFEHIPPEDWNQWNPNPPSETMVTSGPFNVSGYVPGEFVELTRNPYYFRGADVKSKPTFLTPPQDLTYQVGTIGHFVYWTPQDDNPDAYTIYQNDTAMETGNWNGSLILYSVDGLDLGVYDYRLVVNDSDGLWAEQTVRVFVVNDTVAPLIDSPVDVLYVEGEVGNSISWNATDDYPQVYVLLQNGTMSGFNIWTGGSIQINVDGLSVGVYNYTLMVIDIAGNFACDSVFVFVNSATSTTTTTTTTTNTTTTTTSTTGPSTTPPPSDGFPMDMLSLMITLGSILVIVIFVILIVRSRP